jgi:hypothetical protein
VPEQLAAWRGEQQRIGGSAAGVIVEMLLNLSNDAAGKDDEASSGGGFGRAKKGAWSRASVSRRLIRTAAVAVSMSRRRSATRVRAGSSSRLGGGMSVLC